MNAAELQANPMLAEHVVHDLNAHPILPFAGRVFDDVTCCVSVDYLIHPVTVFREVARVLRPSGRFVLTFSNRCFPTKAIQGWLDTDDEQHVQIVSAFFAGLAAFGPVRAQLRTPPSRRSAVRGVGTPPSGAVHELTHECVGPGPARPDTGPLPLPTLQVFRAVITRRVVTRSSNSTAPPTIRT